MKKAASTSRRRQKFEHLDAQIPLGGLPLAQDLAGKSIKGQIAAYEALGYIRPPKRGEFCPVTHLSRTAIYNLIGGKNPIIRSVEIKRPGAKRGVRLIAIKDLLEYVEGRRTAMPQSFDSIPKERVENLFLDLMEMSRAAGTYEASGLPNYVANQMAIIDSRNEEAVECFLYGKLPESLTV